MQNSDSRLNGMIPVKIGITQGNIEVEWIEARLEEFSDLFYKFTLARLQNETQRRTLTTGIEVLSEFTNEKAVEQVKGLIFHVSRCGSTLLSSSISTGTDCIVLSEPDFIPAFLLPSHLNNPILNQLTSEVRSKMLKGFLNALIRDHKSDIVIKNNCRNILDIETLLLALPKAKSLFLFREPIEVLASNFLAPAGWFMFFQLPHVTAHLFPDSEIEMDELSLAVLGLLTQLKEGEKLVNNRNAVCLDYKNLNLENICKICRYFELKQKDGMIDKIKNSIHVYSKDPDKEFSYIPDSKEKHQLVDKDVKNFIRNATYPIYESLLNLQNL